MKKGIILISMGIGCWLLTLLFADHPLSIATFNIRMFPENTTNTERVAQVLSDANADIIAVEEIRDEDTLLDTIKRVSQLSGRKYALALSGCGGSGGISVGFIYDQARVTLVGTKLFREHRSDNEGYCNSTFRAALLAVFDDRKKKQRISALAVHFKSGNKKDNFEDRKRQWVNVISILDDAKRQYGGTVIALGDFNTAGFENNQNGEKTFIFDTLKKTDYQLATSTIGCTSYWKPGNEYVPSVLDHMVVSKENWSVPESLGMCQELKCQKVSERPEDHKNVSDHCPVRIELK